MIKKSYWNMSFLLHHTRCEVPDASGDLLSFIRLTESVISRRRVPGLSFPFHLHCRWFYCEALSEGLIHPDSLETGACHHHGDRCVRVGVGCPEADERSVWGHSEWGGRLLQYMKKSRLLRGFSVSLDLPSQLQELNTFHFFYFIIGVFCAGVKS